MINEDTCTGFQLEDGDKLPLVGNSSGSTLHSCEIIIYSLYIYMFVSILKLNKKVTICIFILMFSLASIIFLSTSFNCKLKYIKITMDNLVKPVFKKQNELEGKKEREGEKEDEERIGGGE